MVMIRGTLRKCVLASLMMGLIFQYWVYGDASLTVVSTWIHVLFWFFIIMFQVIGYALVITLGFGTIFAILLVILNLKLFWSVFADRKRKRVPKPES